MEGGAASAIFEDAASAEGLAEGFGGALTRGRVEEVRGVLHLGKASQDAGAGLWGEWDKEEARL